MPKLVTPLEAAEQLLRRRRARRSIEAYVEYLDLGFAPALHQRFMLSKFEAIERGEIRNLALFLPPGSAKSTYGSVIFPAWYMGNHPERSILACSHTQPLAVRFSRRARNLFMRPDHERLFGVGVAKDSQSASEWATERDGEYFAAGVGVAISGRRCDIGLIDDPVKNKEDADSTAAQNRAWEWYLNDFLPRLKPNAAKILIQTRWNEFDLAGRILDREAAKWTIIDIPMEARADDPLGRAPGERLWPEWFTEEMIVEAKLNARSWSALYQQQPISEEGDYFKAEWFKTEYESIPDNVHYYGASDYAVTTGGGDFTEHGVFALDPFGNLYVVDWWRGQTSADVWIERQCDLIQKHEPLVWFGEAGPIRRSTEPYLAQRMIERNAPCRIEWLPSISDKGTRCRSFQALASMGKIFLPKLASWKAELLHQLTSFDAGRYDDGVDVCSLLGRGLDLVAAPKMKRYTKLEPVAPNDGGDYAWTAR